MAKEKREVKSDSIQSAYDTEATFRDKAGKKQSGYSLSLTETCSEENAAQLVTDYKLDPNNKSDVEVIENRLDPIKERTDIEDLYVDGGYYGEKVIEKANSLDINIHYTDMTGRKSTADKLPLTEFKFNEQLEVTHCPGGKEPTQSRYNTKTKSSISHFSKADCKDCLLKGNCPIKEQKKSMVLRASKKSIMAANVRAEINTKAIKRQNISKRAAIEGTNSSLKRSQGRSYRVSAVKSNLFLIIKRGRLSCWKRSSKI